MAKILIVDDEPIIVESIRALLAVKDHKIVVASDGEQAVTMARSEKPDVVLLDVMLPKIGGFDVCKILKSSPETRRVKIIMLTALDRMGDAETAFDAGADDYIIKPFEAIRFYKKIDKLLATP